MNLKTVTSQWYVYIVRCNDNSLYTGVCTDIDRRLYEHNNCNVKSAKYTRARRPVKLVFTEASDSKRQAYQREYQIKQMPKKIKECLISHLPNNTKLTLEEK